MNQKIKNHQDEHMRLRGALSTSAIAMKGKPTSEIIKEHLTQPQALPAVLQQLVLKNPSPAIQCLQTQ